MVQVVIKDDRWRNCTLYTLYSSTPGEIVSKRSGIQEKRYLDEVVHRRSGIQEKWHPGKVVSRRSGIQEKRYLDEVVHRRSGIQEK